MRTTGLIILILIISLALFLRIFRLEENTVFTGEIGQTYLEVREVLISGKLPLTGLATSHPWLTFGPWYYYLLMILFSHFGYHPVIPAYFSALASTGTVLLAYLTVLQLVNRRTALLSA